MYHTFQIPKKGGVRTISAPDPETKERLRQLLVHLERKQWVSRHAHGFVKGRGLVTNAMVHLGKRYIVNIDISDFFPSITWHKMSDNAPDVVTELIHYGLTYSFTPPEELEAGSMFHGHGDIFPDNRLPQGSPASPYLANLYMRQFDSEVFHLAREFISDDIQYTRYADDLTFSSNSKAVEKIVEMVENKLRSTLGLAVNKEKTKIMKPGMRQEITGLNVNSGRPTISKQFRKKVRAIVHRVSTCEWRITRAQFRSLEGRIAYIQMCHPEEAMKYKEMLANVAPLEAEPKRRVGEKRFITMKIETKRKQKRQKKTVGNSGRHVITRRLRV